MALLASEVTATEGFPPWVVIVVAILGSGIGTKYGPALVEGLFGRSMKAAETASVEATTAAKLNALWEDMVDHLHEEVNALRLLVEKQSFEMRAQAVEIRTLRSRLDHYSEMLRKHGIEEPLHP